MKKFFTLVAAALICAASVSAKKVLESTWSPWGATCTVDGNKLSFTASWAGAGYQLAGETAPLDLSDYDYIVVKMAKCTATTNFAVEYTTDGTPELTDANKVATNASATANAQIVGIPLHLDYSTNVVQMWMQSTTPSLEVEVVEVYAATEDEYQADLESNKQEMSPLSLDDLGSGWGASYDAATKTITYEGDWNGKGWWLSDVDYSDFDKFVVEFAEPLTGYVQVVIEYNNDIASTTVGASAGETKIVADLDAEGKKSVKQIYLQNGEGVRTVVLANAYVATNKYVDQPTGINAVETAKPVENGVMYNLAGQKVGADYKGIVIKNGKKMVVK